MRTRSFGSTGAAVTEVGLGCWQIGGNWGEVDDEQAMAVLYAAADAGVRFFDTADVYGGGRSERFIGQLMKERPSLAAESHVATKLGRGHGYPDDYSLDLFRRSCENSCENLGVDRLWLTQLHCVTHDTLKAGTVFEWLATLRDEGLIEHFGASVESIDEARTAIDVGAESLQIIFNLFRQKAIDELFDLALARKVAVIVRLPLASGLLAGKFNAETRFAESDHRTFNADGQHFNVGETFAGLPFEKGVALAESLKQKISAGGSMSLAPMSMAQWSMRWILDHDAVSVIIPGASRPEHAIDNAAVSELPSLTAEEHRALGEWYHAEVAGHIRGVY